MFIAVFSDTHGAYRPMLDAVREHKPDCVIHLGDGADDVKELERSFPQLPVLAVAGNCDPDSLLPETRTVTLCGITFFLTHGHRYAVRYGKLDTLLYAAELSGAQFAVFGHTHKAYFDEIEGIFALNPGSAGRGRPNTWARLIIGEKGEIDCSICDL